MKAFVGAIQNFHIMRVVGFATFKEWSVYRTHMAVTLFVVPAAVLTQVAIWTAVFSTTKSLAGYSLSGILLYYGVITIIDHFTFDFADWNLQHLITSGDFLTFMLRPVNHIYYAFCQKIGHRTLAVFIEIIPLFLIIKFGFNINISPDNLGWALISIALGSILAFLINYCIGITAFWLTRTNGLSRTLGFIKFFCAGAILPLDIFPEPVQKILFYLPFQYIGYVPARVYMGSYELAGKTISIPHVVSLQAVFVIITYVVYRLLWRAGINRFTGVGS